jgi:hypothetical protein
LVAQRVQDLSSASLAFPVSSTPSQPLQDDKVEAASKLRSKRSNAAVRTPWTKGAEEEKPEPPKQTIGAGAGLSVESVMQSEGLLNHYSFCRVVLDFIMIVWQNTATWPRKHSAISFQSMRNRSKIFTFTT